MKKSKQHFLGQVFKGAASTISFVLGSLSRGVGQQFHVQFQYILDLMIGSWANHRSYAMLSLVHHN